MELVFVIWMIEVVTNTHMWLNLKSTTAILFIFGGILLFMVYLAEVMDCCREGSAKRMINSVLSYKKTIVFILSLSLFGSLWNSIVPSKETAYLMLGAYGVQSAYEVVTESEETKRIAKKSISIIEEALDKYQKEINNESKIEKETKVEQGE